jgi:kynurenine formamidase
MRFAFLVFAIVTSVSIGMLAGNTMRSPRSDQPLWDVYEHSLRNAKYVDLSHTISNDMPVWAGFGSPTCFPAYDPSTKRKYTYQADGFEANGYTLPTDQFGTQLDPPAHWNPIYPAIDELPATFAVRPLVVISIVERVKTDPGYALQIEDILSWEKNHGRVPEGAVVFVRSDWSKDWGQPGLSERTVFPGVSLKALQFLHLERHILMHGHEPLDTDATPDLQSERWLLTNGFTQAEGVTNLDQCPEVGALVSIGFSKFQGGLGGYARYIAICPPDWRHGLAIGEIAEAPLSKMDKPLIWNLERNIRMRMP